jgi:transposase
MDNRDEQEWALRRKAIRLMLKHLRAREILKQIPRGRRWLLKWWQRYQREGWAGLKSQSRRPSHSPQAYAAHARAVVLRVRRALAQRPGGLSGARAVQQELRQQRLLPPVPGLTTIKRWLREAGLSATPAPAPRRVYYPEPTAQGAAVLHASDWIARYLEGGAKVFVFHTVASRTHALAQTLTADKTTASLQRHALAVWQTLGLPHGLQVDNDAACTGGEQTPRRFSSFVRLCLYLGIDLIFVPPREPKRHHLVEGIKGLWARSFWDRDHFHSLDDVIRKSPRFRQWYNHPYCPPALAGLTPAQARRGLRRHRLTTRQRAALPEELPLTAGRLYFIRRVSAEGEIRFLGESWKVGRRLAHQSVWAMVITHCRRLEIYHQRAASAPMRLVKTFPYQIPERVCRLHSQYKR